MKVMANDFGMCGIEQLFYAGNINFDTDKASEGVELCKLPANVIITRAVAKVTTAFDAGTTNKISVGTTAEANEIMSDSEITAGTVGDYSKTLFAEAKKGTPIVAKYEGEGTDATAGAAEIYIFAVGVPE